MNRFLFFALMIISMPACTKDKMPCPDDPVVQPIMQYSNLYDAEMKFGQSLRIDVNHDGSTDFYFETLLVGDPILKRDRKQFYAYSKIETCLLHSPEDQTPPLANGDIIALRQPGYLWFDIAAIVLAEKIIPLTGASYWDGSWKTAKHRYLAIQVKKDELVYNGWIEISFDTSLEKLIFHRAAICKKSGVNIKAGL